MKIKILISVVCLPIMCYHAEQSPGVCPKPPPFDLDFCSRAFFIPGCSEDSDCSSNDEKCCPTGKCHIKNCETPLRRHIPGCPVDRQVCIQYQQLCLTDYDCGKGEKCCYNPSCGTSCKPSFSYSHKPASVCPKPPKFDEKFCSLVFIKPGCQEDSDCLSEGKKCCPSGPCHVSGCVNPIRRKHHA